MTTKSDLPPKLAEALTKLYLAYTDRGPYPVYHTIIKRHVSAKWPTLVAAIELFVSEWERLYVAEGEPPVS